ncbi:hypothetical protein QJS10_CPB14g00698 [Acorus calamus]|uniref:Uncharacterized protein n=1 Tax=Acorus calamus TaxID=4465 RepID=A0AAV9DEQ0_ACOCL|nr:hypothetical protein QJS10_CPB14g00698 [Acorus calamus]
MIHHKTPCESLGTCRSKFGHFYDHDYSVAPHQAKTHISNRDDSQERRTARFLWYSQTT